MAFLLSLTALAGMTGSHTLDEAAQARSARPAFYELQTSSGSRHALQSVTPQSTYDRQLDPSLRSRNSSASHPNWLVAALALLAIFMSALAAWALYRARRMRRCLSENLAAEREHVAAANLAKSRFLAVASHDMRQPLHALSLYLSALDRRIDNPEARAILAKMERATDVMIAMFSSLLELARTQSEAIAVEIGEFALQDVFDRLAAERTAGALDVTPTTLRLQSDPTLLERAMRHLIDNALEHGGGRARLSARPAAGRAEIVIADDGPGIAPEDQTRIFDEFVRLKGGAGLGIGLSIVRDIAKALDIPLEVDSAPGRGARFILRAKLSGDMPADRQPDEDR